MEGAYPLPLKFARKWKWENTWGAGSLMALLLVPWPLAVLTVPHLGRCYSEAGWMPILLALGFGAGWGLGGIFTGLGIDVLGLSLGLSLILGLIAINGSLTPLLMNEPAQLLTAGGGVFLAAIFIMLAGLGVCAAAGQEKERARHDSPASQSDSNPARRSFRVGLLFGVLSGVLSGLVNFALIFGTDLSDKAREGGADPVSAMNALWALVFTSNYLVNIGYCAYRARRNRSGRNFLRRDTAHYWLLAVFMGVLWAGGIVVYGIGVSFLGQFGAFAGFPVLLISSILTANALGYLTGEWARAPRKAFATMLAGICLLITAITVLAYANHLMSLAQTG